MSLNEVLERGKRIRLLSGEEGVILAENENFGFPLWEIKLNDGKIITEARYRFDVLIDPHEVPKEPVIPSSPPAVTEELLQLFQSQMYDSDDSDMQTVTVLPDLPPPPTNTEKSLQPEIPSAINVQKDTTKYIRQFVPIDEEEVDNFIANQENRGTLKKTTSDLRTLIQFLEKKNEKREIHNIPPKELNNLLSQFFISARKSDGENYEPATLKGQFCSFNRFLKRHDYGHDLTKSIEFCKTRDALTAKQVDLKKMGKGNGASKADVLTDADIDALFSSGQLGLSNPTTLLHTVWFCNTVYFGLRGVTEHYQMRWGDIKLCKDHKNNEYIQMNERNTKTRTGTDVKNKREIPQRAWANLNDQTRCPVEAYKLYKSKRPVNFSKPEDPFYIQENTNPNKSTRWYKSQIVGVNKLGKFMKIMAEKSDVLKTYGDLKDTASEKALKEFLSCFKQNSEKLENAVEQLSESDDGSEALTQFGEDFFYSLDKLVSKCQRNRDKAVKQRTDLKEEQEQHEQELRNLLDEQELKYREHFEETERTDINDMNKRTNKISPQRNNYLNEQNVSKTKSKHSPVAKRETSKENDRVEFPSVEKEKSEYINKDTSEQDDENDLKNRNKWNVDTSCPPTFDNMEFIYTNQTKMDNQTGSDSETEAETASLQEMPKESETPTFESQKSLDVLPPVGLSKQPKKTKTKKNYVPNLVVPNRTLELRRSGSLSKINNTSEQYIKSEPQETNEQCESDGSVGKIKLVRSRSSSKDRMNIPQKKPFK